MERDEIQEQEKTESGNSEKPVSENQKDNDNVEQSEVEIDNGSDINSDIIRFPSSDNGDGTISIMLADLLEKFEESEGLVTAFETQSGPINVVHTITLGDLLISTLLAFILIFSLLNQLIRRF